MIQCMQGCSERTEPAAGLATSRSIVGEIRATTHKLRLLNLLQRQQHKDRARKQCRKWCLKGKSRENHRPRKQHNVNSAGASESGAARLQGARSVVHSRVVEPPGSCTAGESKAIVPFRIVPAMVGMQSESEIAPPTRPNEPENKRTRGANTWRDAYDAANKERERRQNRETERKKRAKRKEIQENYLIINEIHHNSARLDEELDELVKNEMSAWTKEQLQSSNKPVEKQPASLMTNTAASEKH